jgi:hypothetical protein
VVGAIAGAVVGALSAATLGFTVLGALLFGLIAGFALLAVAVGLVYVLGKLAQGVVRVAEAVGEFLKKLFSRNKDEDEDERDDGQGKPNGLIWRPDWGDWIPDEQGITLVQPALFSMVGLSRISPARYGHSWRPGVP